MLKKRVVYITPKADAGTDYRAIAKYFKDNATIIDIGEFGQPINPLRIIFDSQSMGDSQEAYSSAYFRHIRTLKASFGEWFEEEFSGSMKGYLEDTLHLLYKAKGIIRKKPETWTKAFPVMSDLREYFKSDMDNKSLSRETRASAGALYRKTSAFGEDGSLSYLNVDTELDLSRDYIVIDISGVDEEIKNFMHVLVTGIVGSRFKTDLEKETVLVVDEARVFLRSEKLSNFLLDAVAMGQAQGFQLILMTQNPNDLIKNKVDEEFKANMSLSLIFGATLDSAKVEPIKKFFNLPDSAVEDLLNCEPGEGLLLISSRQEIIPIRIEATEHETDVIKGRYEPKKAQVASYNIIPEFQALREHHGVILKEWIEGDDTQLIREGWEKVSRLQKATGKGTFSMFVPVGSIQGDQIKLPGLGSMTIEHFSSVVQMESYLVAQKIECYSDHNQGTDIVFVKNGRKYAVEYERGTRSAEDLIKKRDRLLAYDDYRFVCSPENYEHISKVIDKTIVRGGAFAEWVNSLSA